MERKVKGTLVWLKSETSVIKKELGVLLAGFEPDSPLDEGVNKRTNRKTADVLTSTRGVVTISEAAIVDVIGFSPFTCDLPIWYGVYGLERSSEKARLYQLPVSRFGFEAYADNTERLVPGACVVAKKFADQTEDIIYGVLGTVVSVAGALVVVDVGLPDYMEFEPSDLAALFID